MTEPTRAFFDETRGAAAAVPREPDRRRAPRPRRRRAHRALVSDDPQRRRDRLARGRGTRLYRERRLSTFDAIVSGEMNAMAAVLRGAVDVRGEFRFLTALRQLFAGPSEGSRTRPAPATRGGRHEPDVKILDGNTFVVSDNRGDIEASLTDSTGLFSFDTRYLSRWVLTMDGQRLNPLSVDDLQYFETRFFLVPGTGHRLHRRQDVGHTPARRRQRFRRRADAPQPRRGGDRRGGSRRGRLRLRRSFRGQGRAEEAGRVLHACRRRTAWCSATAARRTSVRQRCRPGGLRHRRSWTNVQRPRRAARRVDDRPARVARPWRRRADSAAPKYKRHAKKARPNMERSVEKWLEEAPPPRMRLGPAQEDLSSQHRRPGGPAVLAGVIAGPLLTGGRASVVHDDVRPRQHLHQPAGIAVHARAGARRRWSLWPCGRAHAATISAMKTPAACSTRCASVR